MIHARVFYLNGFNNFGLCDRRDAINRVSTKLPRNHLNDTGRPLNGNRGNLNVYSF
jgi:hypothetical protein